MTTYSYGGHTNLSALELFFWIVVDCTLDQLGVKDVVAVVSILSGQPFIHTRGKFRGATRGTSLVSSFASRNLNVALPFRLPTLTGATLRTLRVSLTNNLGRFVGRTVPIVGWAILAYDVSEIILTSVRRYNVIASQKDRLW